MVDEAVRDYYELGMEAERLASGNGPLELARSQEHGQQMPLSPFQARRTL